MAGTLQDLYDEMEYYDGELTVMEDEVYSKEQELHNLKYELMRLQQKHRDAVSKWQKEIHFAEEMR